MNLLQHITEGISMLEDAKKKSTYQQYYFNLTFTSIEN